MKQVFEVRLDNNFKRDIGRLQMAFNSLADRTLAVCSGSQAYTRIKIIAPVKYGVSPVTLLVNDSNIYMQAFCNDNGAFYLNSYNGLRLQTQERDSLPWSHVKFNDDSYDSLGMTDRAYHKVITKDRIIAALQKLSTQQVRAGGHYGEIREALGILVLVVCESIRFRPLRDSFSDALSGGAHLLTVGEVMRYAKNWEKLCAKGHSHLICVPLPKALESGAIKPVRTEPSYLRHTGLSG